MTTARAGRAFFIIRRVYLRPLDRAVNIQIEHRLEILSGASGADRLKLRRALSALPVLYPNDATWTLLDGWVEQAAIASQRFGSGDLLIAPLAVENGSLIWSLDADFTRMESLDLVRCYTA